MLTKTFLLNYIKTRLGHPYLGIEISDDMLWDIVVHHTIPTFSTYVPTVAFKELTAADRDPQNPTLYYLNDEDGVITVKDVVLPMSSAFVVGHPWIFIPSFEDLPNQIMDIMKARTVERYSLFRHQWEFIPPNKLYIYPTRLTGLTATFYVRYEKNHPSDLSTIPVDFVRDFCDLALADIYDVIADMRSKYATLSTPFGEITLNADALSSKATELRDRIIERLQSLPPNTIVEVV
jgi:predicted DCC family thiol-disulfide oxidoreductase YuxK